MRVRENIIYPLLMQKVITTHDHLIIAYKTNDENKLVTNFRICLLVCVSLT
jgi:hypothetical protein